MRDSESIGSKALPFLESDHTFAVCAYKSSPYLRECLESVTHQTTETNVIIATSTPTASIRTLADEYKVPLFVRDGEPGIADDWNYAVACAGTPLVTIAHQDDTYEASYAEEALAALNSANHPLIYFTNYGELRGGKPVDDNRLLRIKRLLLSPIKDGRLSNSKIVRRRILSFGSSISCPSVTLVLPNLWSPVFLNEFSSNLDWDAWERASKLEGDFYYNSRILMHHRIHEGSETTALIGNNVRTREDYLMLCRFRPKCIARFINALYVSGQKSNAQS